MNSNAFTAASLTTGGANHGPALSIVSWLLLVISTLLTIARLATKWAVSKKFKSDDTLAIGSLVRFPRLKSNGYMTVVTEVH